MIKIVLAHLLDLWKISSSFGLSVAVQFFPYLKTILGAFLGCEGNIVLPSLLDFITLHCGKRFSCCLMGLLLLLLRSEYCLVQTCDHQVHVHWCCKKIIISLSSSDIMSGVTFCQRLTSASLSSNQQVRM